MSTKYFAGTDLLGGCHKCIVVVSIQAQVLNLFSTLGQT